MKIKRISIWEKQEYQYQAAYGFTPFLMAYLHEEDKIRPAMIVVPGGGYSLVSPTEGEVVAKKFYRMGYQAFVLTYTTDVQLLYPLRDQPMKDLSRAIRWIRSAAGTCKIYPDQVIVCGFSAGAHLCGSVCVHFDDFRDEKYPKISSRPDAEILSYPVITAGEYAHVGSYIALLGLKEKARMEDVWTMDECKASQEEIDYFSLEKNVTPETPPCFVWQTANDEAVAVENSYLFAEALKKNNVPFAHHIFSSGAHGLSLSNKDWENADYGNPYTLEQILCVCKAMEEGRITATEQEIQKVKNIYDGLSGGEIIQNLAANSEVAVWVDVAEAWLKARVLHHKLRINSSYR